MVKSLTLLDADPISSARSSNEPRVNSSAVDVFGIGKGKRACRQELILDSRQIAKSLIERSDTPHVALADGISVPTIGASAFWRMLE